MKGSRWHLLGAIMGTFGGSICLIPATTLGYLIASFNFGLAILNFTLYIIGNAKGE